MVEGFEDEGREIVVGVGTELTETKVESTGTFLQVDVRSVVMTAESGHIVETLR